MSSYRQAVRDAEFLVTMLDTPDWQPEIWENLGWLFRATAGSLTVFGDRHTTDGSLRFSCSMNGIVPDKHVDKNPNNAVYHTVNHCIRGASKGLSQLFQAVKAANLTSDFFREFTQHEAIEFIRFPVGRSKADAALEAMVKDRRPVAVAKGKPFKDTLRPSYRDDAALLLRVEAMALSDGRQPLAWRKETAGMARKLAADILKSGQKTTEAMVKSKRRRRKNAT